MKSTMRGLLLCLASLGALGFVGCSEPNEQAVLKDSGGSGKKTEVLPDSPQTQEEIYKYQMEQNKKGNPTTQGYQKAAGGGGAGGRR